MTAAVLHCVLRRCAGKHRICSSNAPASPLRMVSPPLCKLIMLFTLYDQVGDIDTFLMKHSDVDTEESIVYSYTKSFNALALKLSEDEAQKLSGV